MTIRDLMEALDAFEPACRVWVDETEVIGVKRTEPREVALEKGEKSTTVADLETQLADAEKQLSDLALDLKSLAGEITKGTLTPAQVVEKINALIP